MVGAEAFFYSKPLPENWEEHAAGKLPGVVFCTEPCWCHLDPRKTAALGNALANHVVENDQAADVRDGLRTLPPEAIQMEEDGGRNMNELLLIWLKFERRFKSGRGKWTPTREDWLQQEKVGRELLLMALSELPGVSTERIEHARNYLDPVRWRASDFLERVIPIIACRGEQKHERTIF